MSKLGIGYDKILIDELKKSIKLIVNLKNNRCKILISKPKKSTEFDYESG